MACLSSKRVCARAVQEKLMCQLSLSKRNNFHQTHNRRFLATTATAPRYSSSSTRIILDRRFSTTSFFRSLNDSSSSSSSGGSSSALPINQVSVQLMKYYNLLWSGSSSLPDQHSRSVALCCASDLYFGKAVWNCFWILSITTCCAVRSLARLWPSQVVDDWTTGLDWTGLIISKEGIPWVIIVTVAVDRICAHEKSN